MLSTLARAATRRPLTVIGLWAAFLLLGFGLGTGVFADLSDDVPDVPGTESDMADDYLSGVDPTGESVTAVVAGVPVSDAALRAQVERTVAEVRRIAGVAEVPDPYTTPGLTARDGRALVVPVTFEGGLSDEAEEEATDSAVETIKRIDAPDVHVSGGELLGRQLGERAQEDVKNAELISLPVVLALLLVVFGGLRAAALPLVIAVSGIAGAFLGLFAFSQVTDISVYAIQVTTMLGLGLAIDYALLMLVRFREERRHTEDVIEAVHRTVDAAGRTVLFSGLTVAVSLTGLLVFPSVFLRSMGLAVAAVVVVDMLAAVTLLPALLTKFGGRIRPSKARSQDEEGRVFARLARFAQRRRIAVLVTVVPALLLLALPVTGLRIAIGDARQLPSGTEARQLYDTVDAHFPKGTGVSPVTVVLKPGTDTATADRIRTLVPNSESRALPGGNTVVELQPPGSVDGRAATDLVERVRDVRGTEPAEVTGVAARLVDFRAMLADRAPWAALTVLAGIFVLLFAFTGSVLIPLRTIATTLLSLGAALGVVVWVFQDGHGAGLLGGEGLGALSLTAPPLIVSIAFGLAMDYELFILARMREARQRTGDDHEAVVTGLRRSGRVVTCAALLLAVVFGAFMTGGFSPILQIGLGLTLAVLIDATVVRMLLVPATMALLGRRAWWAPGPLRRVHDRFGLREAAAAQPSVPTKV
ncbi:RND superfamily putative drug exporter [Streptomyces sp. SAI-144]|uniref:MMPL family transporter n=1 Tax=unclassified Streptomyces TaxID=2593676 RepID=UPI002473E48F|nr:MULTISPECIES: MMPL family transporter [unclassified Streptomyces]MDH6438555.1 RND superfamily putative drug exporter [Streptomyces sp. SAI-144]MDH6485953.1 RND superfamily putative drug exporter [Streptomyces sp. SAI-127]